MKNKHYITKLLLSLSLLIFSLIVLPINEVYAEENEMQLKEVVVLSRHNIRAPLSTKGSILDEATPHTWFEWSSEASELSLKGGLLETAMGQYFRKYLENEELIPTNYQPNNEEVRFYANAKQRTIATANYFLSGFLPVSDLDVIIKAEYDTMDPTFNPQFTFMSDEYIKDAEKEMQALIPDLSEEYSILSEVLDFEDSEAYHNKTIPYFSNTDNVFVFENYKEPTIKGSLKNATSLADALTLQYYENPNELAASFNHQITHDDWKKISRIKDVYGDVLFTAPLVSVNVANPLLKEIYDELNNPNRKFSFLCGHDSNLSSVLSALKVRDYTLPDAIESKTPIGSKLVFEKWTNGSEDFIKIKLVYDSVNQLRNTSLHDLNNPPIIYEFDFEGLTKNADGYYKYEDFINHLKEAINEYELLIQKYGNDKTVPDTSATARLFKLNVQTLNHYIIEY